MDILKTKKDSDLKKQIQPEISQPFKPETYQEENGISTQNSPFEEEIDIGEIFRVLFKWKYLILGMICLSIAVVSGRAFLLNKKTYISKITVALTFSGIEKHLNPDGSPFNANQLITPNILSKINISNKGGDTNNNLISDFIEVENITPRFIQNKIAAALEKNEVYSFFPNQFLISLTMGEDTLISKSKKEREKILNSVVNLYKQEAIRKYFKQDGFFWNYPDTFISNNDYLESIKIINARISSLIKFIDDNAKKTNDFRSTKTNQTFPDLKHELELLQNIEVKKIEAFVKNKYLTKNIDLAISQISLDIKILDAEKAKQTGKASIANKLLKEINAKMGTLKNSSDSQNDMKLETSFIEKLRTEDNTSYLIKVILESETSASNYEVDKNKLVDYLANLTSKTNKETQEIHGYMENYLKNMVFSKFNQVNNDLKALNAEFHAAENANFIKIITVPSHYEISSHSTSNKIKAIVATIALFLSVFLIFIIETVRKHREKI
jgi:LPS O-antigen subunit length determinant protein (WzzB/FepE family)